MPRGLPRSLPSTVRRLLAVVVDDEPRSAFTERGVDVVIPQCQRLENVAIGVDNIVCPCHCLFLPGIAFPGIVARRLRRREAAPCKRFDGRQTHDIRQLDATALSALLDARDITAAAIALRNSLWARLDALEPVLNAFHPCGPR